MPPPRWHDGIALNTSGCRASWKRRRTSRSSTVCGRERATAAPSLGERKQQERRLAMSIELHTWNTPNGRKISVALEEMGLPYAVKTINISKGEQFAPAFLE